MNTYKLLLHLRLLYVTWFLLLLTDVAWSLLASVAWSLLASIAWCLLLASIVWSMSSIAWSLLSIIAWCLLLAFIAWCLLLASIAWRLLLASVAWFLLLADVAWCLLLASVAWCLLQLLICTFAPASCCRRSIFKSHLSDSTVNRITQTSANNLGCKSKNSATFQGMIRNHMT